MTKSTSVVYTEWKNSLIKGFSTTDLNVCPKGSIFYLGLTDDGVVPILASRTSGGELFHVWYTYYADLLKKAPDGIVPRYIHFYAVSTVDRDNWSADEFDMVNIANSMFIKPVLGSRAYAKMTLPTLEGVVELCRKASLA